MIGTQATEGELGFSAYATRAGTQDYALSSYGVAIGWQDRVELSLARQDFDAAPAFALNGIAPFGVAPGQHIKMDVLGLKVKLLGDAILDADTWVPQVALGLEHKQVRPGSLQSVLDFLGTKTSGTDLYLSATKLLLDKSLLLNTTLRYTNANQNGLLGFGSAAPGKNSRSLQPEFSIAYLLRHNLAVGAEYRFKPNNLQALGAAAGLGAALREDDWKDVFVAWAPSKNVSLTLAWVDPGPHRAGRDPGQAPNRLLPLGPGRVLTEPVFTFWSSTMTTQLCAWAVAAACLLALPAAAQTAPTPSSTAPAGLYQALGEKPGITRLVDDFVNRAVKDPRIGSHFKDTKPQALKESLTDQICQLSGGPCQYEGGDMKSAHADMDITKAHFNALVEVLQAAMAAQGIAFAQQNRLLALLAPMHRDIITVR